jgi:hypothetical protein
MHSYPPDQSYFINNNISSSGFTVLLVIASFLYHLFNLHFLNKHGYSNVQRTNTIHTKINKGEEERGIDQK